MPYALVANFSPVASASNSRKYCKPASLWSKNLSPASIPWLNIPRHWASLLPLSTANSRQLAKWIAASVNSSKKHWFTPIMFCTKALSYKRLPK